jgi:signal transduction histidine kinase
MSLLGIAVGVATAVAGTVGSILTAVAWWNRQRPGVYWFTFHVGTVALWSFLGLAAFVADGDATTAGLTLLANGFGLPTTISWFLFVVTYLGYGNRFDYRRGQLLLFGLGGAYFLAYASSGWTGLLVRDLTIVGWDGFRVLDASATLLGNVTLTAGFALFFVGIALVIQRTATSRQIGVVEGTILVVATLVPVTAGLSVGFLLLPEGLPVVQVASGLSTLLYAVALRRYDLFVFSPATQRIGVERAVEELGSGVVVVADGGTVIEANDTACSVLDRERESLVGESVESVTDELSVAPENFPVLVEMENRYYRVSDSTITDEAGRRIGRSLLFTDVTNRRLREQRLDVLNRVLRHNLRNELGVVTGRAQVAAERSDDPTVETELRGVLSAAEDLMKLGEKARALDGALDDQSAPKSVAVADTVEDIVADLGAEEQAASVETDVPADLSVETNRKLFAVVVTNLIENAVVHTDEATVRVTASATTAGVTLTVADDGPGIPEQELGVIERGEETPLAHGSGLGLWLVSWSVPRLGGAVEFESDDDGTTVTLTVPDQSAVESTATSRADESPLRR